MTINRYSMRVLVRLAAIAVFALALMPDRALAIQNYRGGLTGGCVPAIGAATNVTASVTAGGNWNVTVMTYTFVPSNGGPAITVTGASGVDPNNGDNAYFSLPPGSYTVYAGTPNPPGTPVGPNSPNIQATYTISAPSCMPVHTDTLTVRKTVVNTTGVSTAGIVFPVQVSCGHVGPSSTFPLGASNNYSGTLMGIAIGSQCQVQENSVAAPAGCHWVTTYSPGQTVNLTHYAGYIVQVSNELVCTRCPPGTTEQTYPGTNVKFCCKPKMDPRSDHFCCTREGMPFVREDDGKMPDALPENR